MKKIFLFLALMLPVLAFTACSDDDDSGSSYKLSLSGLWEEYPKNSESNTYLLLNTGVRGGVRVDAWPVVIRAVNTRDAMTAEVEPLDWPLMQKITGRILNEVPTVNRVLYDMSPKPPATIEWE